MIPGRSSSASLEEQKGQNQRECLYQDYGKGGIRMPNLDLMLKALRLAWLPRLLKVFRYNFSEAIPIFFNRLKSLVFSKQSP